MGLSGASRNFRICLFCVSVVGAQSTVGAGERVEVARNVALGKTATFDSVPNLPSCSDPGDARQLTDGQHEEGCRPAKGAVGWRRSRVPIQITFDLEQPEPISGVSFRTSGGESGRYWPNAIHVLVSDDGETFHPAGDLLGLSLRRELPPVSGVHVYRTDALRTHGRFVRLAVAAPSAIVCDEIEVYRGDADLLKERRPRSPVVDVMSLVRTGATERGVRLRMLRDIAVLRKRMAKTQLLRNERARLRQRLDSLAESAASFTVRDTAGFRAILPLNEVHSKIFAINAPILRARGFGELAIWHRCRWDPLRPLDSPTAKIVGELPPLEIMPGEYRSRALVLTNAADQPKTVRISFAGLPLSPTPPWIEPHEVLFTDTQYGRELATALEPIKITSGSYAVTIPAGMTRQIWFRFHPPASLSAGNHDGRIVLSTNKRKWSVSLHVHISKVVFPKRIRCATTIWDYTDGRGTHDLKRMIGFTHKSLAMQNLKTHFVNVTWGVSQQVVPEPNADHFNSKNELVEPPYFARFDAWVKGWDAIPRYYVLTFGRRTRFAGALLGTPEFGARIRAWAAAFRQHVTDSKLIKPEQVGVLIWDEFSTDEQAQQILQLARPLKAGFPELRIVQTSIQSRPDLSKVQELYDLIDIFIPALGYYEPSPKAAKEYYAGHVARRGAELWTYLNMPIEMSDPYGHYRMLAWRSWKRGMTGTGFWSYGDAGGGSWNRYAVGTLPHYSPMFLGPGTIHDTKHWEAFREGLEDYERLALLRDRVKELKTKGRLSPTATRADRALIDVPANVLGEEAGWRMLGWWTPKSRTPADEESKRILVLLESLAR